MRGIELTRGASTIQHLCDLGFCRVPACGSIPKLFVSLHNPTCCRVFLTTVAFRYQSIPRNSFCGSSHRSDSYDSQERPGSGSTSQCSKFCRITDWGTGSVYWGQSKEFQELSITFIGFIQMMEHGFVILILENLFLDNSFLVLKICPCC